MASIIDKARLPRMLAVFVVVALVSAGLCGANTLAFSHFGYVSGGNDPNRSAGLSLFLIFSGGFELLGIFIGLLGTLITLISMLVFWIHDRFVKHDQD